MKILVFTEGTILIQRDWIGLGRQDIVRLVRERLPAGTYADSVPHRRSRPEAPVLGARQDAGICYLSSRTQPAEVDDIRGVLTRFGFPQGELYYRRPGESYQDVAVRAAPDVLLEDDCESIGGVREMTYPELRPDVKARIKSVVVAEFGGIDHLPDEIDALRAS